mgnify:CR=1 FL=1
MRIFLIGFMGSGKTTIGKLLADLLSFEFIDTDVYIESQKGSSVSQIFDIEGEEAFRKLETHTLIQLIKKENVVIATGGGMPCFNSNMALINDLGYTFYLYTRTKELTRRLVASDGSVRPLLEGLGDEEALRSFIGNKLLERERYYFSSQYLIDCNKTKEQVVEEIYSEYSFLQV